MNRQTLQLIARRVLPWVSALAVSGLGLTLAQDLPFSSGSTGADGPLTFRRIVTGGRSGQAVAFDAVRNQLVLFGGYAANVEQGSTWVWDGVDWTQKNPANSPLPRYGARMVWDGTRQEIVLFGGNRQGTRMADTWVWNGTDWTQKNPAASPTARDYFGLAYDAARQKVVLHGGNGGADETWLWDGANWTQVNPLTKPPGHSAHALAYDAARQRVVLFGAYGQTWLWDGNNWAQAQPPFSPQGRNNLAMDYDPVRQEVLLVSGSNLNDVWAWNGTTWTQRSPTTLPGGRQYHTLTWNPALQRMVLFGGDVASGEQQTADTWFWNGTDWSFFSGKAQTFDLSTRASGIFNYTTIEVPSGITVRFKKNAGNTPVRWLASDMVTINGVVDVSGEFAPNTLAPGVVAHGGPGGYDGGRGGVNFTASGSYVGTPGMGPGGGAPGTAQQTNPTNLRDGQPGQYSEIYGNVFLQPLLGGSGGGGGASNPTSDGGHGGGGGGAIMISSSRDIVLNGKISANGGDSQWSGASTGGRGSGGAILLRADRISGPGTLEAFAVSANYPNGRIRVEAYERSLTGVDNPVAVVALPSASGELNAAGVLNVVSIDGKAVPAGPGGNISAPDVVFTDAAAVPIEVSATGVPDGTPVSLRITTANGIITAGPQNLAAGKVTFTVTVPKGLGTVQALATVTQ